MSAPSTNFSLPAIPLSDPHAPLDRQVAARHLLAEPLTCAEHGREVFTLIRRHEHELDRWFTQRLGYRLHVTADTARLFKSTVVAHRRPLRTATSEPRPFTQREYIQLALILAAVAAGPRVISLRDLVDEIRSAATDAGITLTEEPSERRAVVTALNWMIAHGLAKELHERVERYATDEGADAVIEVIPERIAVVPLPSLSQAQTAEEVLHRDEQFNASRQWMRARLVEDPVLYQTDLTEDQWREIRRRLGEEAAVVDDMFGLVLEVRAEGMAAIDPSGDLADRRFPATRTVGHAALLLLEELAAEAESTTGESGSPTTAASIVSHDRVVEILAGLGAAHRRTWSKEAEDAFRFARKVLPLLADHRLIEMTTEGIRVLPMAYRYSVKAAEGTGTDSNGDANGAGAAQDQLW